MIKLDLKQEYQSLKPFQIELPDFTILTGLNGAGKTQILESIDKKLTLISDESNLSLNTIKYLTPLTLIPNVAGVITPEQINSRISSMWADFTRTYKNENSAIYNPNAPRAFNSSSNLKKTTIEKIAKIANKELDKLTIDDFYNHYPIYEDIRENDIFQQNFALLFKRYRDKQEQNEYNQFQNIHKGNKKISFLSDKEFLLKFGEPPWILINKIINEANLDYFIEQPEDYHRDAPYIVKLINKVTSSKINFQELSSGEKVLMSLALSQYNSNFDITFPKVMIMDEPDSSLHPSMSKKFLDVIKEIFVKQKGVKVIITTHSPSTIALAEEEDIFVVNKTGNRIEKATKDHALGILTSGIPSLSINYENRRQVFVESENDVIFYEKIYSKLSHFLKPQISITFISSGESRTGKNGEKISNCQQVINITKTLRKAGNKLIWGFIDWDNKNTSNEYLKVIGDGKRYSIESYLFDPILLAALLLREKILKREELGMSIEQNFTDFKLLGAEKIQQISDYIVKSIIGESDKNNETLIKVKYINELEILIPSTYLHLNGHNLESIILSKYPKLNSIKKDKEELLKLEIIDKVIDDIPEFIPLDILEAFKYVQK